MAPHAVRPELAGLLAARRGWLRRHLLVSAACAAAVAVLAVLLAVGVALGVGADRPAALVLDAALIGLLASLMAGALANAWSAWRFGSRIATATDAVACEVRRLGPETRMRRDYLLVTAEARTVLVRCAEDVPTSSLAEVIDASVLGWPRRRGPIVLLLPHVGPVAVTVGRYDRHLPRALRADLARRRRAAAD